MIMDEKLSLLLGLLISDGSVYFDRSKRTYCVQFTNKNEILLDLFKELMTECFGDVRFHKVKCKNAFSIRTFSLRIAEILHSYSPSFRTKACDNFPKSTECRWHEHFIWKSKKFPACRVPEKILGNKDFAASFLKGYASGDGSLYQSKRYGIIRVELTCYHPLLRKQISQCLELLEIPSRSSDKAVFVSGRSCVKRFLDLVGFIPLKSLSS